MKLNKKDSVKNVAGKVKLIMKWVLTILLFLIGLSIFISQKNVSGKISGIILVLLGCMLCPKITKYLQSNDRFSIYNKFKKLLVWILVIILFILIGILGSENQNVSKNQMNDISASTDVYQEKIEITSLKFNENEIELDIKETKGVVLEILPERANEENLELCTSDNSIATLEKANAENSKNIGSEENTINTGSIENMGDKIKLKIKPISEGECEVYAKSNGIISNKIKIKVIDKERIEREEEEQQEKQEKEAQEQKEKQEKEAQEQKEKQEKEAQEQKARQEKEKTTAGTQKNSSNSQSNVSSQKKKTSSQSNANNSHGKSVYRTPKGKRYHFDPDCGGKNSYQITLDAAKSAGLTPCNKCAK